MDFEKVLERYRTICNHQQLQPNVTTEEDVDSADADNPESTLQDTDSTTIPSLPVHARSFPKVGGGPGPQREWRKAPLDHLLQERSPHFMNPDIKMYLQPTANESVSDNPLLDQVTKHLQETIVTPHVHDRSTSPSLQVPHETLIQNELLRFIQRASSPYEPEICPSVNAKDNETTELGETTVEIDIVNNGTKDDCYRGGLQSAALQEEEEEDHSQYNYSRDPQHSPTYMSRQDIERNLRDVMQEVVKLYAEIDKIRLDQQVALTQLHFLKNLIGVEEAEIDYPTELIEQSVSLENIHE